MRLGFFAFGHQENPDESCFRLESGFPYSQFSIARYCLSVNLVSICAMSHPPGKFMSYRNLIAAIALATCSVTSQASIILFADNFDKDATRNNAITFVGGWTVTNGTVDVDGTGFVHNELPGHGHYIDLDGSTKQAGIFANSIYLDGGATYSLSFGLAGNQRNWGSDTVDVMFGSASRTFVIGKSDPLALKSLSFTPETSGTYLFSFHNRGGDNRGAFLDQVTVSAVPEPATLATLLAGLAALVFVRRRSQAGGR
jgi:hypothetical protein